MNKFIIRCIMLFRPLFDRFNIDSDKLAIILAIKLKMDDRRPFGLMGAKQQNKDSNHSSLLSMGILFLMGAFLLFFLFNKNAFIGQIIYFTIFMVMISLTLISDFTSVLIDVRDNYIILPRPVNDSTVIVSRILHITIHVSKIVIAMCLPALVAVPIWKGPIAGAAFIIEVVSATVLTIFIVNMAYLLMMKVSTPQRFKDSISYFQIAFSVLIFAAYQLLPRLLASPAYSKLDVLSYKISYLLPPVWFASFSDVLLHPENFTIIKLILAMLGLTMPFVSLYIVVKFLAPGFNRKLSSIMGSGDSSETSIAVKASKPKAPGKLEYQLSTVFSKDKAEQAGFRLTWWLTSRYRDFKIKVYPSFAYVPVYFAYFLFMRRNGSTVDSFEQFSQGKGYVGLTYLTSFVILTVLQQVTQAEKFKAAWVMFSTPHNKPGKILAGTFKALVVKYFLPYYLLIAAFSLFTWGIVVVNDLVLAFFNILVYGLILALFTIKYLPFSQPVNNKQGGGRVLVNLAVMSFIGLLGFVHYGISRWEWAITALIPVSGGICWAIYHYFQGRNWEAMEADYD